MEYPNNQMAFEKSFATEEDCIKFLFSVKYPGGYNCLKCGFNGYWLISRKRIKCKQCGHTFSITKDTIFEQTNKSLIIWFRAIWWMIAQKNGVSALGLQSILGIGSYKTAWIWLHKLRELMVFPERQKLSGKVEIDETFVGGKGKGKRGRGAENKSVVIIAVEVLAKGTGRVRISQIKSASANNLNKFIDNNIDRGTTIITDGWKGYSEIQAMGFTQEINRQIIAINEEDMLPNVHRVASLLKRWLIGTHQNFTSEHRLQKYLDEFTFRYNRRKSNYRGLLFYRVIERAVNHTPVSSVNILKNTISKGVAGGGKK